MRALVLFASASLACLRASSVAADEPAAISGLRRYPTSPESALKADIEQGRAKFQAAMTVGLSIIGMNEKQLMCALKFGYEVVLSDNDVAESDATRIRKYQWCGAYNKLLAVSVCQ